MEKKEPPKKKTTTTKKPVKKEVTNIFKEWIEYQTKYQAKNHYKLIYYPMKIPGQGRPVDPPRMEMGAPCDDEEDCCCGGGGINSNELIFLLRAMGRIPKNGPPDLSLLKFGNKLAHYQEQK